MHSNQLFNEAVRLHGAHRLPEAEALYRQVLTMAPQHPDALNMLGFLFHQTDRDKQAIPLYRQAIGINPNFAPFHSNLAHALLEIGDREGALRHFRRAIKIDLRHCEAGIGLAITLREVGHYETSIAELRRVLELDPGNVLAHTNLGFVLLMCGDLEQGWKEMEWRTHNPQVAKAYHAFPQPRWTGPDARSERLLVRAEQGLGDSIQFCRYVPMAAALGLAITLEVQAPLVRLFQTLGPDITVVPRGEPLPRFDHQIPMLSLPEVFGTSVLTIPAVIPYLHPDAGQVEHWRGRLAAEGRTGLRVGLVWAGNLQHGLAQLRHLGRERTLDPMLLRPLLAIPGIMFVSLQKDVRPPRDLAIVDVVADVSDMAETAALIANLDLVISIDTSVAHLAGAMGKPIWLLDRSNHDWRWLAGKNTSPWYPSMRIYRQTVIGQWKPVLKRVAADLRVLITARTGEKLACCTSGPGSDSSSAGGSDNGRAVLAE